MEKRKKEPKAEKTVLGNRRTNGAPCSQGPARHGPRLAIPPFVWLTLTVSEESQLPGEMSVVPALARVCCSLMTREEDFLKIEQLCSYFMVPGTVLILQILLVKFHDHCMKRVLLLPHLWKPQHGT